MSEISVTIRQRPLGIRFGHFYDSKKQMIIGIHEIQPGSHSQKLGLLSGDILKTLNGTNIYLFSNKKALDYFRNQPLPFCATFIRGKQNVSENNNHKHNSDDYFKDFTDEIWISHINTNCDNITPLTSAENTPIGINSYVSNGNSNTTTPISPYMSPYSTHSFEINSNSNSLSDTKNSCSNTLKDTKNSCSLYKHKQSNTNGRTFSELAGKLLSQTPKISLPMSKSIINDFVFVDEEDSDKQIEYNALCEYFTEIDFDTKHLVSGYVRNLTNIQKTEYDSIQMLISKYVWYNVVMFDKRTEKHCNDVENTKVCATSSNGFKYGIHEWSIKVLKSDIYRQEIGIIERNDKLDNICIEKGGIGKTNAFGARAVYGNMLFENKYYYASYNDNGQPRCKKGINQKIGWCTGDVIKVILNLRRGSVQFFLNGKKVRKTVSVQKHKVYYPIISFSGNCQYKLVQYS